MILFAGAAAGLVSGPRGFAAPPLAIEDFRQEAPNPSLWRAQGNSPPPRAVRSPSRGLAFACPFDRVEADRFYWDRDLRLDLSRHTALVVELSCDVPTAIRSLAIYLQSGDGWYVWSRPLPGPGLHRLVLRRHEFGTEGTPAGWHEITRLRLSPWRGDRRSATLILHAMGARSDSLILVQGTTSVPETERAVARSAAQRIGRWLQTLGVSFLQIEDDQLTDEILGGATMVILPYNPRPTDRQRELLVNFANRGGRLMVFYGADEKLADAMGFRLGSWKPAESPQQWVSIRFLHPIAWGFPDRVFQNSGNLLPVHPAAPGAEIVAAWEDAQGRLTGEPALVVGPRGAWMSHILLPGDTLNKQQMLAAILFRFAPDLASELTLALARSAGRIDSYANFEETMQAIRDAADRAAEPARVRALLDEARAAHAALQRAAGAGRPAELLTEFRRMRDRLTEAYARVQRPVRGELRAVWDHAGTGLYPGDWDRTGRELRRAGLNTVFANTVWAGLAHYPSEILPRSMTFRLYGDQNAAALAAARRHGLKVHIWYVCWYVGNAPSEWRERLAAEGRLQADPAGRTIPWLAPSDPRNIDLALCTLREIAERYAIDGIHLDYVRWPETESDFSPVSRAAFERHLGRRVARWPDDVRRGGRHHDAWREWRVGVIHDFVRRARETVRSVRPEAALSAAVWGSYPGCIGSVGQDWPVWVRRGWVDFVVPMNYTENLGTFVALTTRQMALGLGAGRLFPGIGVGAADSSLSPDLVIEQILAARRLGARGFALFQLDAELAQTVLPMLRLGVTRDAD